MSDELITPRKSPGIQTRSQKARILQDRASSPPKASPTYSTRASKLKKLGESDQVQVNRTSLTRTRRPGLEGGGSQAKEAAQKRAFALGKQAITGQKAKQNNLSNVSSKVKSNNVKL